MTLARLKHIAALESRQRPAFKPFDYAGGAAALRDLLALVT